MSSVRARVKGLGSHHLGQSTSILGPVHIYESLARMRAHTAASSRLLPMVAQAEREAISRRTKEALAVAKASGVKLGNPNGAACLRRAGKGGVALRAAVAANAARHAADLAGVVADIRAQEHTTLRAMAAELNARGVLTRRGGRWHVSNVKALTGRIVAEPR